MNKDRTIEIQYYDWRLVAWLTSETRDRLDATGRGIYRELLDQCYAQGGFPYDTEWICRKCACTPEELATVWPIIERHFPCFPKKKTHRHHWVSDIFRKKVISMLKTAKISGKKGGQKSQEIKRLSRVPSSVPQGLTELTNRTNERNEENEVKPPTPCAPNGADSNGHLKVSRKRKDKRTTDEVRAALGPERLVWWNNFWEVFPCHDGMNEGINAFELRVKDHELAVAVWKGAKSYRAKCDADPTIKVKFAQGWLNSERWLDENNLPAIVPRPAQKSFVDDVQRLVVDRISKGEQPW